LFWFSVGRGRAKDGLYGRMQQEGWSGRPLREISWHAHLHRYLASFTEPGNQEWRVRNSRLSVFIGDSVTFVIETLSDLPIEGSTGPLSGRGCYSELLKWQWKPDTLAWNSSFKVVQWQQEEHHSSCSGHHWALGLQCFQIQGPRHDIFRSDLMGTVGWVGNTERKQYVLVARLHLSYLLTVFDNNVQNETEDAWRQPGIH
jgi:hypothetical protein